MLSLYGRRTWFLAYNPGCSVNLLPILQECWGEFALKWYWRHTHTVVPMSLGLPRSDWLPLRSPIFQGFVPPNPLVLLLMVESHLLWGPDTFREHVSQLITWLPSFALSSLWDVLKHHKVSLLDSLWTHFDQLRYVCFLPCKKISETKKYSLAKGMYLGVGWREHREKKQIISINYFAPHSTVRPLQQSSCTSQLRKYP